MPTLLFHEKIASELKKRISKIDTPEFYLGCIAPDAVSLNGFAERDIRYAAHLRDSSFDIWRQNLQAFFIKQLTELNTQFLLGYVTHILTDIIFDEHFYWDIRKKLAENGIADYKQHERLNIELNLYEGTQLELSWFNYVLDMLARAKAEAINDIPEKTIIAWNRKIMGQFKQMEKTVGSMYITDALVDNFVSIIKDELMLYVKKRALSTKKASNHAFLSAACLHSFLSSPLLCR